MLVCGAAAGARNYGSILGRTKLSMAPNGGAVGRDRHVRLSPQYRNELLDDLGLLRQRLICIMAYEEIRADMQGIVRAIDRYAGSVTGNPQYF